MPHRLKAGIIGLGILGRRYVGFFARHPAIGVAAAEAAVPAATGFTNHEALFRRGPLPTHGDGLRQVHVIQAIVDSAVSDRPVAVTC